jgi:hypothetical protein
MARRRDIDDDEDGLFDYSGEFDDDDKSKIFYQRMRSSIDLLLT